MESTGPERSDESKQTDISPPWQVYRQRRLTRSAGRTLLSEAFSDYMALFDGMGPSEIAAAFDRNGDADDRELIEREIHFLTGIFVEGRIKTFSRLAGGSEPAELPTSTWELDDAVPRFATAALNLNHPHNTAAPSTHWIFVDTSQWDAAMEGLRHSRLPTSEEWDSAEPGPNEPPPITVVNANGEPGQAANDATGQSAPELWRNEIMTREAVIKATGLKRSTIYAKIAAGTFPRQIAIHGSRTGWRRGQVQDWLDALDS